MIFYYAYNFSVMDTGCLHTWAIINNAKMNESGDISLIYSPQGP